MSTNKHGGSGYYTKLRNRSMKFARQAKAAGFDPSMHVVHARRHQWSRLDALRRERVLQI